MRKVELLFGPKFVEGNNIVELEETRRIYMYLKQVHNMRKMNPTELLDEIRINKWSPDFISPIMLTNSKVSSYTLFANKVFSLFSTKI